MSKHGTRIGRRALYAVALASIRKIRNDEPINKVLLNFYKENMKGKSKKVDLVAIMHKLINYIFSVLKNQKSMNFVTLRYMLKCILINNLTLQPDG